MLTAELAARAPENAPRAALSNPERKKGNADVKRTD